MSKYYEIFLKALNSAASGDMNLREAVNALDVCPTAAVIKTVVTAKRDFEQPNHKGNSAWEKNNFMSCPWGLAWNVSPKGRRPNVNTVLQYFAVAIIIEWDDLVDQLTRTIKSSYRYSKNKINEVANVWEVNIDSIVNTINTVLASLQESKVINEHYFADDWRQTAPPTSFPKNFNPDKLIPDFQTAVELLRLCKKKNMPAAFYKKYVDLGLSCKGGVDPAYFFQGVLFSILAENDDLYKQFKTKLTGSRFKVTKEDMALVNTYWEDHWNEIANLFARADAAVEADPKNYTYKQVYRVIVYDASYSPPCKRHIFITKTRPNGVRKIALGSAQMSRSHSSYDEPLFDSKAQAQAFINNLHKIDTRSGNVAYLYGNISDKPIDLAVYDLSDTTLVNTDLGPAYIHNRNTCINESLLEDLEKHDTLNPKLFDLNTEKLLPEVKDKIDEIVSEFISELAEDDIGIDVADVVLIGSNVSYNYTKDSDLDVHIIADISNSSCPDNLYTKLYSAYRSIFNKNMNINIRGIPVELYVETEGITKTVSNGIYSVTNDEWIKEPVKQDIPDIDMDEFETEFAEWEDRYNKLIAQSDETQLTEAGDYKGKAGKKLLSLLAKNGPSVITSVGDTQISEERIEKVTTIHPEIPDYDDNGEVLSKYYDTEEEANAAAKRAKAAGLDCVVRNGKFLNKEDRWYVFPCWRAIAHHLDGNHDSQEPDDILFIMSDANSVSDEVFAHKSIHTIALIDYILQKVKAKLTDNPKLHYSTHAFNISDINLLLESNGIFFIRTVGDEIIYYDTLEHLLAATFAGENNIRHTLRDARSTAEYVGDSIDKSAKAGPEDGNETASPKTIQLESSFKNQGAQLQENITSADVNEFITDIYDLRHDGLENDGEYSIGNLIFKEVRNRGWLDNLKELRNMLVSKDLSLEMLKKAETEFPLDEDYQLDESNGRDYLTNSEIYAYKTELSRQLGVQVLVFSNGHFTINNVRESDAVRMLTKLNSIDFVLEAHKVSSGKYDFGRMNFNTRMPASYFTINGKIDLER